jgi:hypothetical protein
LLGCLCAAQLGWLIVAAVPVGTASVSVASAGSAFHARALKAARTELARVTAPNMPARPFVPRRVGAVTQVGSYNWSGYANSSSTAQEFSAVSGSWKVVPVTCTKEDRIVASWVGIDGYNDGTVEQLGTMAQCFEGTAQYYTWYEMYPSGSVVVGSTVQPGDKITASVKRSGTSYALKLTDATTSGNNINVTQTCAASTCLDQSAEWIVERPSYSTGIVPLAEFDTPISFTSASEKAGGKTYTISTGPSPAQIFMVDSTDSYDLATPSALNAAGNAFSVTWDNSY